MADTVRVAYSGTNIDFSPQRGYDKPFIKEIKRKRAKDGTLYSYKFFVKGRWELPIRFMSSTNAGYLNTWWDNDYTVTFYPDMINSPATSYSCKITNSDRPLSSFPIGYWEENFEGSLILEEI